MNIKVVVSLVAAILCCQLFIASVKVMIEEHSIFDFVVAMFSGLAITLFVTVFVLNCGWL